MEKVDVAIVGLGIAGGLIARNLARQGHSVTVVEREPVEKLGHDWWDSIDKRVFAEVDLDYPKPPELVNPPGPTKIFTPTGTHALTAPPGELKIRIERKPFAARLAAGAKEAGARIIDHALVLGPIMEGGKIRGFAYRDKDGNNHEIRAKITVDSSGMAAILRRQMPPQPGFPQFLDRRDMFVTYREIRANLTGEKSASVLFGESKGLCWIKSEQEGVIDFFAGYINFKGRPNPRVTLQKLIAQTPGTGDRCLRGGYGKPLPVRHCFDSFVADGFVLCGDTACTVSPMDGSGMASTLRAAHFSSKAMHEALLKGDVSIASLWPAIPAYKRTQGAAFAKLDALQRFIVSEDDSTIDLLFRRGLIGEKEMGAPNTTESGGKAAKIISALKLLDHPATLKRIAVSMSAVSAIKKHFEEYPETYSPESFKLWADKKQMLFNRIYSQYQ